MSLARSTNGRFAAGNAGGPGNPHARRTAHFKRVLLDAITDDDLRGIVASLIEQAKSGNAKAAELVLNRLVGKATSEPLAGDSLPELLDAEVDLAQLQSDADRWRAHIEARRQRLLRLYERLPPEERERVDAEHRVRMTAENAAEVERLVVSGEVKLGDLEINHENVEAVKTLAMKRIARLREAS